MKHVAGLSKNCCYNFNNTPFFSLLSTLDNDLVYRGRRGVCVCVINRTFQLTQSMFLMHSYLLENKYLKKIYEKLKLLFLCMNSNLIMRIKIN